MNIQVNIQNRPEVVTADNGSVKQIAQEDI